MISWDLQKEKLEFSAEKVSKNRFPQKFCGKFYGI
jgi:hypothetical protein